MNVQRRIVEPDGSVTIENITVPDPTPYTATLAQLLDAIPDARYTAWETSVGSNVTHKKYWNALHGQSMFTPAEWDAWADKFRTEGLFIDDAQRDTFKAAKPVG